MAQLTKAQVEANLQELDDLLKSQIVQGGNSDVPGWAGSEWDKVTPPMSTPNGTDYVPEKKIAHKAQTPIGQLSRSEIEAYLNMVKASNYPNPIAAEQEILATVPGVAKAQCPDCGGTQINKANPSEYCGRCNGHGYLWLCKSASAEDMIHRIEEKWNVNKAGGPQAANLGGASGAADPTPPEGRPYRQEALDDKGEDVVPPDKDAPNPQAGTSKSTQNMLQEMKDMDKALAKANGGDEEEEEVEEPAEEPAEEGAEMEASKCVKKSVEQAIMFGSFQTLNRGQATVLVTVDTLSKSVQNLTALVQRQGQMLEYQGRVLGAMAKSHSDVSKSLMGVGDGQSRPARGPKAVGPGNKMVILQKGWADQAPGTQQQQQAAPQQGEEYEARYQKAQWKTAVWDLIQKGQIDHRVGLRLDAGSKLDGKTLAKIEKHLDDNPSLLQ